MEKRVIVQLEARAGSVNTPPGPPRVRRSCPKRLHVRFNQKGCVCWLLRQWPERGRLPILVQTASGPASPTWLPSPAPVGRRRQEAAAGAHSLRGGLSDPHTLLCIPPSRGLGLRSRRSYSHRAGHSINMPTASRCSLAASPVPPPGSTDPSWDKRTVSTCGSEAYTAAAVCGQCSPGEKQGMREKTAVTRGREGAARGRGGGVGGDRDWAGWEGEVGRGVEGAGEQGAGSGRLLPGSGSTCSLVSPFCRKTQRLHDEGCFYSKTKKLFS